MTSQSAHAHLYTIPPVVSFLPELAHFIFEQALKNGGLHTLPDFKILLPSRRAVRALQFECLKYTGQKSLLMPRFMPIGDVDDEELDLSILSLTNTLSSSLDLPPIISPIDRRLWLMDLIAKKDPQLSEAQCLDFAKALARLMDQINTENLNLADLKSLVSDKDLSLHWQQTVEFLDILSEAWPAILKERHVIESSYRRNYLLKLLATHWQDNPPQTPIIAAGSTGSIPAVADLLSTIAHLPQGHVILPSFDPCACDPDSQLPPSHPQSIMYNLVEHMKASPAQVKILNHKKIDTKSEIFIREIMHPAERFLKSNSLKKVEIETITRTINIIEAEQEREEAHYIALILREIAEDPLKTAMVVTPDRNMARRISAELKRWNITVNDSAGQGLHTHKIAIFLKQIMQFAAGNHQSQCFLSILRSHFFKDKISSQFLFECEQNFYQKTKFKKNKITHALLHELKTAYPEIQDISDFFLNLLNLKDYKGSLKNYIESLIADLQLIITPDILWQGQAGEQMTLYLQELIQSDTAHRVVTSATAISIIEHFWAEKMVRDDETPHPNITILGQIEARLLKADVMILSGLNEGIWPQDPVPDPFMSRPMRAHFGLPQAEKQYALSAHDFITLLASKQTYLVRSLRHNGAPTIKARWLQRLEAYLKHHNIPFENLMDKANTHFKPLLKYLHNSDHLKIIKPPSPQPPASARPHDFYVTDIEKLIKNPYQFYTHAILKLRPFDDHDEDKPYAEAGTILHSIFEHYALLTKDHYPAQPELMLRDCAEQIKNQLEQDTSSFWHFFWEKFDALIPSFIELDKNWRTHAKILALETKAKAEFILNDTTISLRAKADRVDQWHKKGLAISDYKSGAAPSDAEILDGRKPQLPLEMLMAQEGAFGKSYSSETIKAAFWCIPDKAKDQFEIKSIDEIKKIDTETLINRTREEFLSLVELVINSSTPFNVTLPKKQQFSSDESIHHLARSAEWGLLNSDDPEGESHE